MNGGTVTIAPIGAPNTPATELVDPLIDDSIESPPQPDPQRLSWLELSITSLLVFGPLVGVVLAGIVFWHHGIGWLDVGLALGMYVFTGLGLSIGFHRYFTHHSFRAQRWLKVTLAIAGSMGVEGSVISWVSLHRRHHSFADRPGDPHTPVPSGPGPGPLVRGLWHAHAGWLFTPNVVDPERWGQDLLADPDLVKVSALAPLWAIVSLGLPLLVGWLATGTLWGALMAGLWAGVVRMALLHHVTWGTNSLCHSFGSRPFRTRDQSTNLAFLSVLSFGDSWHNGHHAFPVLARHGMDRGQLDLSAETIRLFETLGWASAARWPTVEQLAARRIAIDV
jgi:stearoyl-CoA desaturase (Delta-9 desaturase)